MLLELKLKAKKILDEEPVEEVKIEPTRKISKRVFKTVETASNSDEWASLNKDFFKSDAIDDDDNTGKEINDLEENSKFTSDAKKNDKNDENDIKVYPEKLVIPVRKQNSLKSKTRTFTPLKIPGTNPTTNIQQNLNEGISLFSYCACICMNLKFLHLSNLNTKIS